MTDKNQPEIELLLNGESYRAMRGATGAGAPAFTGREDCSLAS